MIYKIGLFRKNDTSALLRCNDWKTKVSVDLNVYSVNLSLDTSESDGDEAWYDGSIVRQKGDLPQKGAFELELTHTTTDVTGVLDPRNWDVRIQGDFNHEIGRYEGEYGDVWKAAGLFEEQIRFLRRRGIFRPFEHKVASDLNLQQGIVANKKVMLRQIGGPVMVVKRVVGPMCECFYVNKDNSIHEIETPMSSLVIVT